MMIKKYVIKRAQTIPKQIGPSTLTFRSRIKFLKATNDGNISHPSWGQLVKSSQSFNTDCSS